MASTDFDVVVIGSGFGGAVTACRLAEAGYGVLVLERGRRWQPEAFPRAEGDATNYPREVNDPWIWDQGDPERGNGWIDFRTFPNMSVVQGAGVGGGSLIYANVSVEPAAVSFEQGWPKEITHAELLPFVDTVGEMLEAQTVPDGQLTQRFKLVKEAAEATGSGDRFRKLPLAVSFDDEWTYDPIDGESPRQVKFAKRFVNTHGVEQGTCVQLGNCDIGCDAQAKNTLDLNYIPRAERAGAEVRALHMVRKIIPENGNYRVEFDRIDAAARSTTGGSVTSRLVIVACGSLGSTELLLRCRDEFDTLPNLSEFLGHHWSSNGDFLTPAIHPGRRVSPTEGVTISGAIDFVEQPLNGERFFIQDGGFPNIAAAWAQNNQARSFDGAQARLFVDLVRTTLREGEEPSRQDDPFSTMMPWFAQGQDNADGELKLKRQFPWFWKRELGLDWDISGSEKTIETIIAKHEELALATGGKPLVPLPWTLGRDLITPHPLGGCNMSDAPGTGTTWTRQARSLAPLRPRRSRSSRRNFRLQESLRGRRCGHTGGDRQEPVADDRRGGGADCGDHY